MGVDFVKLLLIYFTYNLVNLGQYYAWILLKSISAFPFPHMLDFIIGPTVSLRPIST